MAFEEIKAKLGLDVTQFERGVSKAQGSLKSLVGDATKKFTDFKQIGQTLATALGLNLQNIAEHVARFVTGFSKDQEEALNDLVAATEDAARKVDAALADKQKEAATLRKKIADEEEKDRRAKLTLNERELEIAGQVANLQAEALRYEKEGKTEALQYLRIKSQIKDLENEAGEINASQQEETAKRIASIRSMEQEIADVVKMIGEEQKKQNELASEKTRLLAQQTAELRAQVAVKEADMKAERRSKVLPSLADVVSGKRNIGSGARNQASGLERERARSERLADRVQRRFEDLKNATTDSAREKARRELGKAQSDLAGSQQSIRASEAALGPRVSDANPFAAMEAELKAVKDELVKLNGTTLAPTKIK